MAPSSTVSASRQGHLNSQRRPHRAKLSYRAPTCAAGKAAVPSGWGATTSDGDGEIDRLRNLGQAQNYNINIDHGMTQYRIFTLRSPPTPHASVSCSCASPVRT